MSLFPCSQPLPHSIHLFLPLSLPATPLLFHWSFAINFLSLAVWRRLKPRVSDMQKKASAPQFSEILGSQIS